MLPQSALLVTYLQDRRFIAQRSGPSNVMESLRSFEPWNRTRTALSVCTGFETQERDWNASRAEAGTAWQDKNT